MSSVRPPAPASARDGGEDRETKRYWRSLERLYDSPAVQDATEEFPAGASERPDVLSRRTMVSLLGASFALAGTTACRRPEQKIVPYVHGPEGELPGVPRQFATVMPLGTAALGVVVESDNGRPTKIEGNELHPDSGGSAHPWAQASILSLYDPARSATVLRRGDGEEGHAPATWEEFETFWKGVAEAAAGDGGAGLAVISEGHASPTLTRLGQAFRDRYPAARWLTWEPLSDEAAFAGIEAATGQAARPVLHLEAAEVVVALDADLLGTESGAVANARGFAARRRQGADGGTMNRLYAVESSVSLTGANADHRLRLKSGAVAAFASSLAAQLGVAGAAARQLPPAAQGALRAIAEDLRQAGSRGLVVAGRLQPPSVHALALAINHALGAVGTTLTLHGLDDVARNATAEEFLALAAALRDGTVKTLVVLGSNPAATAPADLALAEALAVVPASVHLGQRLDETGKLCTWHLPQAHFLEAWGDARAADGTLSVAQPLIAPLFGSRSSAEILALLAGQGAADGLDLVKQTAQAGGLGEAAWLRALHDGVVADSALPPLELTPQLGGDLAGDAVVAGGDGLELVFTVSRSLYDGRFANNAWLQELPDPITKITWNNAALISPATAARLGLAAGDGVRLRLGEAEVEAAAWILPGQTDDSVALALGYGRTGAGPLGNGLGADAYRLRTSQGLGFAAGLAVEATGRRQTLVQTQDHWSMEGRPLVREASLEEYKARPTFAQEIDAKLKLESLWPEHAYTEGYQWGMTIDLNVCTGCNACVVACQSENNIPVVGADQIARGREMHWLRVDRYFAGDEQDPEVVFQPIPCMHCENAPCEQVCPVAATVHTREGLNSMVYNRCIGTRYCSNNCPYKVRRFNFYNFTKDTPELAKMAMNPDVTVRSRGVMEKCTYCVQRINQGKIAAKKQDRTLADGEVKTACQQTCPTNAIAFGNIADPESEVSRLKGKDRNYVLLAELNNKPRTSYLAKLRNPNPRWAKA